MQVNVDTDIRSIYNILHLPIYSDIQIFLLHIYVYVAIKILKRGHEFEEQGEIWEGMKGETGNEKCCN